MHMGSEVWNMSLIGIDCTRGLKYESNRNRWLVYNRCTPLNLTQCTSLSEVESQVVLYVRWIIKVWIVVVWLRYKFNLWESIF